MSGSDAVLCAGSCLQAGDAAVQGSVSFSMRSFSPSPEITGSEFPHRVERIWMQTLMAKEGHSHSDVCVDSVSVLLSRKCGERLFMFTNGLHR